MSDETGFLFDGYVYGVSCILAELTAVVAVFFPSFPFIYYNTLHTIRLRLSLTLIRYTNTKATQIYTIIKSV